MLLFKLLILNSDFLFLNNVRRMILNKIVKALVTKQVATDGKLKLKSKNDLVRS